ncbi:radical SAM protein, partial [Candidatus Dojkabacteria bacterium]|nr:radical SAM protein [Candidatus Dojkabacteria bacterium]
MSKYAFDVEKYIKDLAEIISEILSFKELSKKDLEKILKRHPKDGREIFSKDQLVAGIDFFMSNESNFTGEDLLKVKDQIKMKPIRTISGVTTVTVLTKPFPCPGECIFCPNDVRMPKSYIATEPGAQRALANRFSPYLQTWNRLQALKNIGHPTEKIELLVLGGTWSSYSEEYQIWFISECFRAMNDFSCDVMVSLSNHEETNEDVSFDRPKMTSQGRVDHTIRSYNIDESGFKSEGEKLQIQKYLESDWNNELREKVGELPYNKLVFTKEFKEDFAQYICSDESALPRKQGWTELEKLHKINSTSKTKCVGLVLETRPDEINEEEALRLRKLGATKIQLGIQTLNDDISKANKRGEGGRETSRAFNLLRMAGFKIHAHIMPNLYKATPELDKQSYQDLFSDENYKPDEVKIYPTSVIKFTELYNLYEQGEYKPYETETLVDLIADMMEMTPEYCRLTRIIRDIPSTEIEAGNKTTNLREVVEWKLAQEGRANPNIRAREIKDNLPAMLRIALQAG